MNAAELLQHYARVRRRLTQPQPRKVDTPPAPVKVATRPASTFPEIAMPADRWRQIIREVEDATGVSFDDIRDVGRASHLVEARRLLAYRLRHELAFSYPRIARLMERDHTTILSLLNPKPKKGTKP